MTAFKRTGPSGMDRTLMSYHFLSCTYEPTVTFRHDQTITTTPNDTCRLPTHLPRSLRSRANPIIQLTRNLQNRQINFPKPRYGRHIQEVAFSGCQISGSQISGSLEPPGGPARGRPGTSTACGSPIPSLRSM